MTRPPALDRRAVLRGAAALGAGGLAGCAARAEETSALVAGSLASVADRVPGASVEAHGSVAARRLVVEGVRDPDALALADPVLFEGITDHVRLFATNALVVAVRPDTAAERAFRENWRAALTDDRFAVGRTDPAKDPLGYRTVLALRLADGVDADAALAGMPTYPETALLRTLEAGGVDAAFAYRNMAVGHDLPAVDLPDAVDLSNPALADHYAEVAVRVDGRLIRGAPIRYGAAALTDRGTAWTDRLVEGAERLREAGFEVPESYPERWHPG